MSLTREQEYAMFDSAVKAIIGSSTLMLSTCFDDLLKLISYDDPIRICVTDCYNSIDYERLLVTSFEKKDGKFSVDLPSGNKAIVGFVTKLIYEFHLGTQSFDKLMISLYGSSGDESMRYFSRDVLNPSREAFRQVFLYEVGDVPEATVEEAAREINPAVFNELYAIVANLRSEVEGNNKLNNEKRSALMELIDGLCYTIEKSDGRAVKASWLGMSMALSSEKACENSLSRLETLLQRYMLI